MAGGWWGFRGRSLSGQKSPASPPTGGIDEAQGASLNSGDVAVVPGTIFHPHGKKNLFFKEMADYAAAHGKGAIPRLAEFLKDPDWEVRCAALRALGLIESEESQRILLGYLQDGFPVEESAQAALSLGNMQDPRVTDWLIKKAGAVKGEEVQRAIRDALTSRPYGQTANYFQTLLGSATVSGEEKGSVLSGLGFHQSAPAELLASYTAHSDPEVRSGAYEGLAARKEERFGQMLLGRVALEEDAGVRQKVYEAAGAQQDTLPIQMAQLAGQEADPAARLRAERAWGMAVGRTSNSEDRRRFDAEAVPRLIAEALQNPDPGEQRAALQALAMARTPESAKALENISRETKSPRLSRLAASLAAKIAPPE